MENYSLIKLDAETILNLNHIVSVGYAPDHFVEAKYSDSGRREHIEAKLVITTTAVKVDTVEDYDGKVTGSASKSKEMRFYGDKADHLWNWLSDHSYVIV